VAGESVGRSLVAGLRSQVSSLRSQAVMSTVLNTVDKPATCDMRPGCARRVYSVRRAVTGFITAERKAL
jgi:hypothetical protein